MPVIKMMGDDWWYGQMRLIEDKNWGKLHDQYSRRALLLCLLVLSQGVSLGWVPFLFLYSHKSSFFMREFLFTQSSLNSSLFCSFGHEFLSSFFSDIGMHFGVLAIISLNIWASHMKNVLMSCVEREYRAKGTLVLHRSSPSNFTRLKHHSLPEISETSRLKISRLVGCNLGSISNLEQVTRWDRDPPLVSKSR
jgi:hypothetical protein